MSQRKRQLGELSLQENANPKRIRTVQTESSQQTSRAGIVQRIVLKNFMCHSYFEINFNRNINFLVGRNGSGKSAIITALVVGLGGKATVTNRGSSVKSFIKANETSASVEITLHNEGSMAYRPDLYGDELKIVRTFGKSSSAYKVKLKSGETQPITVKEVLKMTSFLCLDVNNPVCILNQDTSRHFLNSADAKQKYKLVMKATKICDLYDKYQTISSNRKNADRLLKQRKEDMQQFGEKVKKYKKIVDTYRYVRTLQARISNLGIEFVWAKVNEAEADMNVADRLYRRLTKDCEDVTEFLNGKKMRQKSIQENIDAIKKQMIELKHELQVNAQPQNAVKGQLQRAKDELDQKTCAKKQIGQVIEKKNRDVFILERDLQKATGNMNEVLAKRKSQLDKKTQAEENIVKMQSIIRASENDFQQLENAVAIKIEEDKGVRNDLRAIDGKLNEIGQQIRSLQSDSKNSLAVYGKDMPRVLQMIATMKHLFKKEPYGPLGRYISITDKKWQIAVESAIGPPLLNSFFVDNSADNIVLSGIFQKIYGSARKPQIIIGKFFHEMFDTADTKTRSASGCIPLMDVLIFSDPVVTNCIIDQKAIETLLLISQVEIAERLMSNARTVPRNCKQAITIEGHQYYPDPNYRMYKSMHHTAKFIQVSAGDLINQQEKEQTALQLQRTSCDKQFKKIESELNSLVKQKQDVEVKMIKMKRALVQEKRNLETIEMDMEPSTAYVSTLTDELTEVKKIIQTKALQMEQTDSDINKLKETIQSTEQRLATIKESIIKVDERVEEYAAKLATENMRLNQMGSEEQIQRERLKKTKQESQNAQSDYILKQKVFQEQLVNGNLTAKDRMENVRPSEDIASEIEEINRTIRNSETNDIKEVASKYNEMNGKLAEALEIFKLLKNRLIQLTEEEKHRSRLYKAVKEVKLQQIQNMFKLVLEHRNFNGSLVIDTQAESLDINVQAGDQGTTNTSNLSGGERSFSTIAFLHSIWQCMDAPFYFLDEFDVFMDKVNRTISIDVLINHARNRPELQFVFLTPQDISSIETSADITIHRLADPVRND